MPLRGVEVDRALDALDAAWANEQAELSSPQARRDAERRYARQRRRLQETTRTRVVAGYVELQSGTPADLTEAQELRAERQRERRADQQRRRTRQEPPNGAVEPDAPTDAAPAEPTDTESA